MARKPAALARELLRNFPKGRRGKNRRRRKTTGPAQASNARGPAATEVVESPDEPQELDPVLAEDDGAIVDQRADDVDGDLDDDPDEVDAGDDDEPADANGKLDEFPRSAKAPRPDDAEEAA